jgi:polysaccharide biosynthesis transport protein
MAVDFRSPSAGEIFKIMRRKVWHILLPTLATLVAFGYVVSKLPSIYESKSLLTVKPSIINTTVVAALSDEDLSQRIGAMNSEVLSRSQLEPMIAKYELYQFEKSQGTPMELLIEKMKGSIKVTADKTNEKVSAFTISFQDRDPRKTQQVTAELASRYVSTQIDRSVVQAETTRDFLDKQVSDAKTELDLLENRKLEIMSANRESLPDTSQGLIAQLTGLHQREETISKEKESLMTEKGRLNQSISALNSQMSLIERYGEKSTRQSAEEAGDYQKSPAFASLIQKRADLQGQLDNLLKKFKEKHPDVGAKRDEIKRINEELDLIKSNSVAQVEKASEKGRDRSDLDRKSIEIEKQRLESQIKLTEQQMVYKDNDLSQNKQQIAILEAKINTIPDVKVALEGVTNQYQSAKAKYDDLQKKQSDSKMQLDVASNAQGETIKVQDAANLPTSPVNASKRYMLIGVGTGVGLALGLFLVGLIEIPRLFKIKSVEDAKHYTGLPILATVPPLLTYQELAWNKRLHWMKVFAAIAATVGSIPLIAMALQMSKILEKIVS